MFTLHLLLKHLPRTPKLLHTLLPSLPMRRPIMMYLLTRHPARRYTSPAIHVLRRRARQRISRGHRLGERVTIDNCARIWGRR